MNETAFHRAGEIARWSQMLIPTAREAPADAETPSHIFMSRAGLIRKVTAGVYSYLPLGHRVLRKVEQIVREEMNAIGSCELLLPALMPLELLRPTGRDEAYGDLLFTLTDRHGRRQFLGPTHEEVITDTLLGSVSSYKALPLTVYQIQTKYRDEFRPRAGLLRCREFLMKDAYSFHLGVEGAGGLNETYDKMYQAYVNIFTRCGLDFSVVEAESGPIGGSASHEFMVNCESGEDTILFCPASGYAANVEKCEIGPRTPPARGYFVGEPSGDLAEVHTPDCPGIDDVCAFMKVKPDAMLKTVVFKVVPRDEAEADRYPGDWWVVACVRGDHEVNEGKVRDVSQCQIELADPEAARKAGFEIGFVSPRAVVGRKQTLLIVDPDAAVGFDDARSKPRFWVTGADRKDYHVRHFNWQRDFGRDPVVAMGQDDALFKVASIRNAVAGDPSPRATGSTLQARRGIEVGHIFKLGDKYSKAMGFEILDAEQKRAPVIMGCYGIGVSRTVAACVEQSCDSDGIIWPAPIAPYHVLITLIQPDAKIHAVANTLAGELSARGLDVLIDDRDERPGVKFKDADLVGIPVRVTVGAKALADGHVEVKHRRDKSKGELAAVGQASVRCAELLAW
ncbi:MAG: proline--tRNA ligase [Phycisphaerales bacterium]|nr:proline--tRNA ligase [Phycisphaerales bacterium]